MNFDKFSIRMNLRIKTLLTKFERKMLILLEILKIIIAFALAAFFALPCLISQFQSRTSEMDFRVLLLLQTAWTMLIADGIYLVTENAKIVGFYLIGVIIIFGSYIMHRDIGGR